MKTNFYADMAINILKRERYVCMAGLAWLSLVLLILISVVFMSVREFWIPLPWSMLITLVLAVIVGLTFHYKYCLLEIVLPRKMSFNMRKEKVDELREWLIQTDVFNKRCMDMILDNLVKTYGITPTFHFNSRMDLAVKVSAMLHLTSEL